MLLRSVSLGAVGLACDLAALLSERDVLRAAPAREADVRLRLDLLQAAHHVTGGSADRRAVERIKRTARQWEMQLQQLAGLRPARKSANLDLTGVLLAIAYPDRIAQRQKGTEPRYLLANGRGAVFTHPDPLAAESFVVIAELDAGSQWARIDLAAPITQKEIEELYDAEIVESEAVLWEERTSAVRASRQRRLGALVLSDDALSKPDPSLIAAALLNGVRRAGLHTLAWTPELENWRLRVRFLRRLGQRDVSAHSGRAGELGEERVSARSGWAGEIDTNSAWPDVSDERLSATLEQWLGPYIVGMTTLDRIQRMDLTQPLQALLSPAQQQELNRLAPTHLAVPSGSQIRLDYAEDWPVLAVRLQEMFGCKETPRIVNKSVPVTLHLLSPAKRPVQVTKDLASFWANAYPEVRRELRGRYPKHHWPEDPLNAPPTAKTKKRH
jgi:ATP-dependent helicase HrpB